MYNVHITGQLQQKRRVTTYVRSVLTFLAPRVRRDIDIYIKTPSVRKTGLYGSCDFDGNVIEIEISKTDLEGKPLGLDAVMLSLAHELVHAKQFIMGDLLPGLYTYKGKDYTSTYYSKQPWEREAYAKQQMLMETFWL